MLLHSRKSTDALREPTEPLKLFMDDKAVSNNFLKVYKNTIPVFRLLLSNDMEILIRTYIVPFRQHKRKSNVSVDNEVVIIIARKDFGKRDVIVQKQDKMLQRISENTDLTMSFSI
ncbi:hypothetical protein CEXT_481371 [Caerostris extrusa]|uniref:Uncharacterized protein n=1 Tax=Caerostris extrusa TaxID=172846 RepID=A0AAV4R973_CAEEX|nr:hypothetical protein CEXT_481371 [Caerostris extrusa]